MTQPGRYSIRAHIQALADSLETDCTACGLCIEECPLLGRGVLAHADPEEIATGRLGMLSDGIFCEPAYLFARACLRCGACEHVCPVGIDAKQANHVVRVAAAASGGEVAARYANDTAGLRRMLPASPSNPFRLLHVLQARPEDVCWYHEIPDDPPQVDVLLFLSCVGMARVDRIHTLMDLFRAAGVRFAAIAGLDFCCGLLDALAGDLDTAQRHLDHLAAAIEAFGATELVTDCPSCYGWFHDLSLTQDVPFRYRHSTQLLAERLGDLPQRQEFRARVTVHDPCHYGRRREEYEPSRVLVAAVPGLELVELERNRENTACCGGPASGFQPELARQLAGERMDEAAAVGAELLLTPCSGCVSTLEGAGRERGIAIDDVVGPLAKSLGIAHENRLASLFGASSVEEVLVKAKGALWETTHAREAVEQFVAALLNRPR